MLFTGKILPRNIQGIVKQQHSAKRRQPSEESPGQRSRRSQTQRACRLELQACRSELQRRQLEIFTLHVKAKEAELSGKVHLTYVFLCEKQPEADLVLQKTYLIIMSICTFVGTYVDVHWMYLSCQFSILWTFYVVGCSFGIHILTISLDFVVSLACPLHVQSIRMKFVGLLGCSLDICIMFISMDILASLGGQSYGFRLDHFNPPMTICGHQVCPTIDFNEVFVYISAAIMCFQLC